VRFAGKMNEMSHDKVRFKGQFKSVRCKCGKEIVVVPDLDAMVLAIRNHANGHNREDRERIEDYLCDQVLTAVYSSLSNR
jgi:hypothetical protein